MLKYYQSISMRLVKDLDVFKDKQDDLKTLETMKNDNTKQDEVIKLLEEAGLDAIVMDCLAKCKEYDRSMKDVYTSLYKMGIISTQRIPPKKSQGLDSSTLQLLDDDRNRVFDSFERI